MGSRHILRGVEANKYYLKKSGVKQSPTQLFEGIGAHHSNLAKEKYLLQENEYVILVGELK